MDFLGISLLMDLCEEFIGEVMGTFDGKGVELGRILKKRDMMTIKCSKSVKYAHKSLYMLKLLF